MLTFFLASLLAAPAGDSWPVVLRPAIVVKADESEVPAEVDPTEEPAPNSAQNAPRLAPARTEAPRAEPRKVKPRPQAASRKR